MFIYVIRLLTWNRRNLASAELCARFMLYAKYKHSLLFFLATITSNHWCLKPMLSWREVPALVSNTLNAEEKERPSNQRRTDELQPSLTSQIWYVQPQRLWSKLYNGLVATKVVGENAARDLSCPFAVFLSHSSTCKRERLGILMFRLVPRERKRTSSMCFSTLLLSKDGDVRLHFLNASPCPFVQQSFDACWVPTLKMLTQNGTHISPSTDYLQQHYIINLKTFYICMSEGINLANSLLSIVHFAPLNGWTKNIQNIWFLIFSYIK